MSSSEPLKSLLAVKQAAEAAASAALGVAVQRRAAAEANQLRLDADLGAAREALRSRRRSGDGGGGVETALRAAERERFWARLAGEIAARSDMAAAHRGGVLAGARAVAEAAFAAHRAASEAREIVQRLREKAGDVQRQAAARREEAALDELAATRHRR